MSFFTAITFWAFGLFAQGNPDSLYQSILASRTGGTLSIIPVDKSIAFELQKSQTNSARLSELFFYRGELLQNEMRDEEAVSAYTRSLNYAGDKWFIEKAYFNRGCIHDSLGLIQCRQQDEEKLVSSELFWIGKHSRAESIPPEFDKAETDFKAAGSPEAKERLMRLHLIEGKIPEAGMTFQELNLLSGLEPSLKPRIKAYEMLLCEAKEDFPKSDSIWRSLPSQERVLTNAILNDVRTHRMIKPIHFEWIDKTTQGITVHLSRMKSDADMAPYAMADLGYSMKRLMFEGRGGGFLVSGMAGAFGMWNAKQNGLGAAVDVMGTFLGSSFCAPGGGFLLDLRSFGGTGRRIFDIDGQSVFLKSESGFGLNLNGGFRHKLFVFASYDQHDTWLNDLSGKFSISRALFDSLHIDVVESQKTQGVFGMGNAGTGWWPNKTNLNASGFIAGFNTHLSRNFTFGSSWAQRTSDLTDQDELTVNRSALTYAHQVFFSERISLVRLGGDVRTGFAGFQVIMGGHHLFECSHRIVLNSRSAQVVRSIPEPNGINKSLMNVYDQRLDREAVDISRSLTGYLPSVSRLYLTVKKSRFLFSIDYRVNGLRSKNREIRFSVGMTPKETFLTQSLHDLALWR